MNTKILSSRDVYWLLPISLLTGGWLAAVQKGTWWIGWLSFSGLLLAGGLALLVAWRWAGRSRTLAGLIALAFLLRLLSGVALHLLLPVFGYADVDDRAGYVFTDAHRRDVQAWELAASDRWLTAAFSKEFYTDQYGGLLALSALVYRYLSPDAHRPLLLVLLSALVAALGVPFLWQGATLLWGECLAALSAAIFTLYPESILLGGSAMREPYLLTASALLFWGVAAWQKASRGRAAWGAMALALLSMILISPVAALANLLLLAGWLYFAQERTRFSWRLVVGTLVVFLAVLFLLAWALNRQGTLSAATPLGVLSNFLREAVKWDVYQLKRGSGWVQKLFDEMPSFLRLPFVVIYGIFQPVLPAVAIEPAIPIWRLIGLARAVGWYTLLPLLVFSFFAVNRLSSERTVWRWFLFFIWLWVLLVALRGGGDQWDNPRYRAILLLWQALLAGHAWLWWRDQRNAWFLRILEMEAIFLLFFTQWYLSRYYHLGGRLPFGWLVVSILLGWGLISAQGLWSARRKRA
ncbi:MAG: hypothetical protein ACP5QU_06845 [Anaerolineae bacterium]